MGTTLALQSATVVGFANHPTLPRIIVFSTQGVDVYRASDMQRVAWAAIGNVTCGAANNNGIYVGTSDAGIYRLPLTMQDCAMGAMTRVFGAGAAVELASYDIKDLSGHGSALVIVTAAEMVYLPSPASAHTYTGSGTPLRCAINGSYLAWGTATGVEIAALPTGDWSSSDASTPDAANRLTFEAGTDNLLICHSDGLRLVDCTDPASAGGLPTDGLVAHWTFDAVNSTTVYDECGNHNGTLVGSATAGSRDGQIGKALNCDGIDGGMTFGNLGIFGGSFTAAAWVQFDRAYTDLSLDETIFSFNGEKSIAINRDMTTGKIHFYAYDGTIFGVYSATIPVPGERYHVACRWRMGTAMDIFVNGSLEETLLTTRLPDGISGTHALGLRSANADRKLDGCIDEVRIYNRELADSEIATLQQQTALVAPRAGLVSHYTMDAVVGTTLYDETGTQNGTISGATQVDGYLGKALSFDGSKDFVELPYNSALQPTVLTAGTWAYRSDWSTAPSTTGKLLSCTQAGGYSIQLSSTDNYIRSYIYANAQYQVPEADASSLSPGWHFIAATFDGQYAKLYIDGELIDTVDAGSTYPITYAYSNSLLIGAEAGTGTGTTGEYWPGALENVRIYNRAISANEIGILYAESFGGFGTNYDSDLGTATDCQDAWKAGAYLAYGTRNGSDGGRFGILQLDEDHNATSKTTVASTDTDAVWLAAGATEAIYNNTHERYRMVAQISPGANAIAVRRDWTLYADIIDALGGIQAGTVALTINGQAVTPTTSAITNGYAVAYTPGSSSGYAERVVIELSGTDADGNTVSRIWSFVAAPAPGATVTDSTPPNVVCTRDIGLSTAEADEQVGGVNVIWLEDIAGPLVVTDAQAVAVGTLAIDEVTYHRHIRTMTVMPADANGLPTRDLRAGQVVTMTCPAIGMTAQKCEVLAIQRKIDDQDDITFTLQIAYYEAVT